MQSGPSPVPELDLVAHRKDRAAGSREYRTDEDLLIMTALRHVPQRRTEPKPAQNPEPDLLPEFVLAPCRKIGELHSQLQDIINSLETRIDAAVQKEETEFLAAYKSHLVKIQNELDLYKSKMDSQQYELKHDAVLIALQQSLAFFKEEAARLAGVADAQRKELDQRAAEIDILRKDKTFLESQVRKAQRENKALKLMLQRNGSELIITPLPCKAEGSAEQEEKTNASTVVGYNEKLEVFLQCLRFLDCGRDQILDHCRSYFQSTIKKHEELETSLRQQLEKERKAGQRLRNAQTESLCVRSDLERLFCECVEEARHDVFNRRMSQTKGFAKEDCSVSGTLRGSDKVRVMERFLKNERLLQALYGTVFSPASKVVPTISSIAKKALNSTLPSVSSLQSPQPQNQQQRQGRSPQRHRVPLNARRCGESVSVFVTGKGVDMESKKSSPGYCVRRGKLLILPQNRGHRARDRSGL